MSARKQGRANCCKFGRHCLALHKGGVGQSFLAQGGTAPLNHSPSLSQGMSSLSCGASQAPACTEGARGGAAGSPAGCL